MVKHIALDMDGTIYHGKTLFPFTNDFLTSLAEHDVSYSFLTNNSSKSLADYVAHLKYLGVAAEPEQIYTSAHATIEYLKAEYPEIKRLYLVGTPSLVKELEQAGYEMTADSADDAPDAVLAAFDLELNYATLCRAAYWIQQGKPFFATHPDFVCPTDLPTVLLDCGAVCAALTAATGIEPLAVLGKPDPRMLFGLCHQRGLEPAQMMMVGDRIYTDMEMARRAGAVGVLVLSGEATREDVEHAEHKPDFVVQDLSELGELLQAAWKGD